MYVNDTKLGGVDVTSEGFAAFQRDLYHLDNWAKRNLREFSHGKQEVLHLGRDNQPHVLIWTGKQLSGKQLCREAPGGLGG